MSSLEMIAAYVREYREKIELHWSKELLWERLRQHPGDTLSAGYCGPSSVLLCKKLSKIYPQEKFSVAVGMVYRGSSEFVRGKHVWVVWHQGLRGATVIDVTADQSGMIGGKVIVEDIDDLSKRDIHYTSYQLAHTIDQIGASVRQRAELLESRLSDED